MFSSVVSLYRAVGCPQLVGDIFSYSGILTEEISKALKGCDGLESQYGVLRAGDIQGENVEIDFQVPANEYGRFHSDFSSFIKNTPSLGRGVIPNSFYIRDINYFSGDAIQPESFFNLKRCCELIVDLSRLAESAAEIASAAVGYQLLFVLPADGKSPSKTFSFRTKMTVAATQCGLSHVGILKAMLDPQKEDKIHIEERKVIFRVAIADVLSAAPVEDDLFLFLVQNWPDVLSKYRHNLQSYVNGFSFEKVRKEIALAEVEYSTKLSGVLGDIAGKLLALPLSLAAIKFLLDAKAIYEFVLISIGLVMVTIVMGGVLYNQWLQAKRLKTSFNSIFGQFDGRIKAYPVKLSGPLAKARQDIEDQSLVLERTFLAFLIISLFPVVGVLVGVVVNYGDDISSYAVSMYESLKGFCLCCLLPKP